MFAIPGILALVFFVFVRPQEILPVLQKVPLLYIFFLMAVLGWAVDVRLRFSRLQFAPHLGWALAYLVWAIVTLVMRARHAIGTEGTQAVVAIFLCLLIAHGVQTFRGLRLMTLKLLAIGLFLSLVGIHQAYAPQGCVSRDENAEWVPDGRECETREACYETGERGLVYQCERLGLFGTVSLEGRVRYRGILQDPNEMALAISIAIPFALALLEHRRTLTRLALAVGTVGLVGLCTVFTRSRSGQLVFLTVIAGSFLRIFGWRGLAAGGVLAVPVMLLGGRSDASADESANERLGCWSAAIEMFRGSPLFGVGAGQFAEHHHLTAHNSFMLNLGEMGAIGLFLWSVVVYVSFKIPFSLLRSFSGDPAAHTARIWATAILSSLSGLMVASFFLSFSANNVFWIYLGVAGALHSAARFHAPDWRVRFGLWDAALVAAIDLLVVGAILVFVRYKGF